MAYFPAPVASDQAKPSPWNVDFGFVSPEWQWAWQGLRRAYPLDETTGLVVRDVADRTMGTRSGAATWLISQYGITADVGLASAGWNGGTTPVSGAQNRTAFLFISPGSTHTGGILSIDSGAGGGAAGNRWTIKSNSGLLRLEIEGGGYTSALTLPNGQWQAVACILNGSTLANHLLYVNGKTEQATGATVVNTTATHNLFVGRDRGAGAGQTFIGRIAVAYLWDRALTVQELDLLAADPFGLVRPNWDYAVGAVFDPANLQASVAGDDVTLTWDV